jgi:type II secretory pathway pseudopilin PulG
MNRICKPRDRAFTITELLVAIALVVLLIVLLLPAINTANETARMRRCSANQNGLALAITKFDSREGSLPGWRHRVTLNGSGRWVGFAVPILPHLDQIDVYNAFVDGTASTNPDSGFEVATYLCPTIGVTGGYRPGRSDYGSNFGTGYGTDWLHRQEGQQNINPKRPYKDDGALADEWSGQSSTVAGIASADGLAMTLLTSEVNRDFWIRNDVNCFQNNVYQGQMAGCMVFGLTVRAAGTGVIPTVPEDFQVINTTTLARSPVSQHPGGVLASFADGSTRFLTNGLAPHVYAHLVTSRSVFTSASPIRYGTNSNNANSYLRAPPAPASPFKVTERDL